jgi:type II secretory pathway component GspD/PulD (secretin)
MLRECATDEIRVTGIRHFLAARKTRTKENAMKYIKPEIVRSRSAAAVIQASANKPGLHTDGMQATASAYEADE